MDASALFNMMLLETGASLYMTIFSTLGAYALGLPIGLMLMVTEQGGIRPMPVLNMILGTFVNVLRSIPFLIFIVIALPIPRFLIGTSLGYKATTIMLIIAAFVFVARMVESSIKEVDKGVIEAARSMGASTFQIIYKVLVPEAKSSLILGAAISATTILGYSAMAGIIGGGGLGFVAINYGFYRYQPDIMWIAVIILIFLVMSGQLVGSWLAKKVDKR